MQITKAYLQFFCPKNKPFYVIYFEFNNGKTWEQNIFETPWGENQMEMYCDYKISFKNIGWFSNETMEQTNKRLQRLIGQKCGFRTSAKGMRYLIIF